jgi:uncharacterized protein (TIGR03067 family)
MVVQPLLALSLGLALPFQGERLPQSQELDRLQGEWVCVETASETRTDRGDDGIRMIIAGSDVTMKFAGRTTNQGTIKLSVVKGRNAIDMDFDDDNPVRGVYELDGDKVVICFAEAGKARPAALTPTGTQWQEKWRRVRR